MNGAGGQDAAAREPQGLAPHLPALTHEQATWAHSLARAVARALSDCRTEVACLAAGAKEFYIGPALAWQPGPASRAPAGSDGARLAQVLDAAEDWLDEIEEAAGLAAEFTRHGPLEEAVAAVRVLAADGAEQALLVPLAQPRPIHAAAPQVLALTVTAARLALEDAEALGTGDLLLLGAGPWKADAHPAGFAAPAIVFDPAAGRLSSSRLAAPQRENTAIMASDNQSALQVPVSLKLPDVLLGQEQLERLAGGGTVELGPVGEGLTVELAVAGRHLARGELVTIGDRFAVLIADPAEAAAAPQAGASEEDA